ncbi:uncharacterized protein [Nicotiana tomentosiformis]|uniref:uncharacterized protein n=1 Tax=Nicotiana tomentosiformis TaxID=4098 RepID=UPI00388C875E
MGTHFHQVMYIAQRIEHICNCSGEVAPRDKQPGSLVDLVVPHLVAEPNRVLACVVTQYSLLERIKARQYDDLHLLVLRKIVLQCGANEVTIGEDGVLRLQGHLCVSNVDGLREKILDEAHSSRYSIHPGATKMYHGMRQH